MRRQRPGAGRLALDRKDLVLPLSPGRAERHGFEHYRRGTLSLYAVFNTETGEVAGKTAARHTLAELVAFLANIVANQPKGQEIHLIADVVHWERAANAANEAPILVVHLAAAAVRRLSPVRSAPDGGRRCAWDFNSGRPCRGQVFAHRSSGEVARLISIRSNPGGPKRYARLRRPRPPAALLPLV